MSECLAQQRPWVSWMAHLQIVARLFPRSQRRGCASAILTQSRRRVDDASIHHSDRDRLWIGSHLGGSGAARGVTRPTQDRRRRARQHNSGGGVTGRPAKRRPHRMDVLSAVRITPIPKGPDIPRDQRDYLLPADGWGWRKAMAPIDYFMSIFCGMCIGLAGWAFVCH